MTSFELKIVALISMLCDHTGLVFLGSPTYFNVIGRIAFPIFAFQISEGYTHTKNLKKYILRLIIFALTSQLPFVLFRNSVELTSFSLNIFFTLLLGLLSITIYDKCKYKYFGIIPVFLLVALASIFKCDYGWYGVTLIFLFHLFKANKLHMNIAVVCTIIIKYLADYIHIHHIYQLYFAIGALISLLFINFYNNKKGKNIKYLLYIFYPLHLFILALIKLYIIN